MSAIEVRIIKESGQFVPSADPVTLSKASGHHIEWHNDTQEQITIKFDAGTPFPGHMNPYVVAPGKSSHSGSIEGAIGKWKYNIEGTSGTITDPEVIIQP
jgi:hypothetical protein